MADRPEVSVLIPSYQRCETLHRALTALATQTAPAGSYEVVVGLDESTDGTDRMLETFDAPYPVLVAAGPRRSRGVARNEALKIARGEIIISLDDDMEAAPEFIEGHRRHHPPGSRVCVMGAVPVRVREGDPLAARYIAAKFDDHMANISRPDHVFVPRDLYDGNMSLRAEVMREIGGFDDAFGIYGNEDVELFIRLRAVGVTIRYDGTALATQEYPKGLGELEQDTLAKGRTAVMLARMHPESFKTLRLAAPNDASRPWLAARAALLECGRQWPSSTRAIVSLAPLLERLGFWRRPLFYRALLDYLFWVGVDAELREGTDESQLARLAAELQRGPINFLLHG